MLFVQLLTLPLYVREVIHTSDSLLHSWWILVLRGVFAILFGVLAIMWPGLTLLVLVSLFAAYALLSDVVSAYGAFKTRKTDDEWWLLFLLGLVGIGAGIITFIHPLMTTLILVLLMAANAPLSGVLDIAVAIRMRKLIQGEWRLILAGIVSIAFGVLVFLFPAAGALALVWMISLYAFLTGVLMLSLAFSLRASSRRGVFKERRVTLGRRHASPTPAHP